MSFDLISAIVIAIIFGVSEKPKKRNVWLLAAAGFFTFFISAMATLFVFKKVFNLAISDLAQGPEFLGVLYAWIPLIAGYIASFVVYKMLFNKKVSDSKAEAENLQVGKFNFEKFKLGAGNIFKNSIFQYTAVFAMVLFLTIFVSQKVLRGPDEMLSDYNDSLSDEALVREEVASVKSGVLGGKDLDAMDLLIAMNSLNNSFNPIELSPKLKKRLSKYDNKVKFKIEIKGVSEPFLADGAKTIISADAKFGGTLEGALTASIDIMAGEVGVINGDIFVSEGTEAIVNGDFYKYRSGSWVQTNT